MLTDAKAVARLEDLKTWAAIKREAAYVTGPPEKELRALCVLEAVTAALDLLEGAPLPNVDLARDHMGVLPLPGPVQEEL